MINHVRTHLLNLPAFAMETLPGSEYIPSDFSPVALPYPVNVLHEQIYEGLSNEQKNTAVRLLLNLINCSFLDGYITWKDPRITYSLDIQPYTNNEFWKSYCVNTVKKINDWAVYNEGYINKFSGEPEELKDIALQYSDNVTRACAVLLLVLCYG